MAKVFISSVIPGKASDVWSRIRDFNGLPQWHPVIRESHIENAEAADKIGCVRNFKLQNGDGLREQLVAMSDTDMFCSYIILESPMPLENYQSTLRLTPITDGDLTFAQWTAEFDCEPDNQEQLVAGIGNDVFQAGFDALKTFFLNPK